MSFTASAAGTTSSLPSTLRRMSMSGSTKRWLTAGETGVAGVAGAAGVGSATVQLLKRLLVGFPFLGLLDVVRLAQRALEVGVRHPVVRGVRQQHAGAMRLDFLPLCLVLGVAVEEARMRREPRTVAPRAAVALDLDGVLVHHEAVLVEGRADLAQNVAAPRLAGLLVRREPAVSADRV